MNTKKCSFKAHYPVYICTNTYLENYSQDKHRNESRSSCNMAIKIIKCKWKLKELSSSLQNSLASDIIKICPAVLELSHALRKKNTLCEFNGHSAGLYCNCY